MKIAAINGFTKTYNRQNKINSCDSKSSILSENKTSNSINFTSGAKDFLLSKFNDENVDFYANQLEKLQIQNKEDVIKEFKYFCMQNLEIIERKKCGLNQDESKEIAKCCYDTFKVLLGNDDKNSNLNLKNKVFHLIYTYGIKYNVPNPVEYLQYCKDLNGKINFDLAQAMMNFTLDKNDKSYDLSLSQKEQLVLRYCSKTKKDDSKQIDIEQASILSSLFFEAANAQTLDDTDKIYSIVYDCEKDSIDEKKAFFAFKCIKHLKAEQKKAIPFFLPIQNDAFFNKMIFEIVDTLIKNNSDKIHSVNFRDSAHIFNDILKYVQDNRYLLDNQIYIKDPNAITKANEEILINDLDANDFTTIFYTNDIFRMHSLLTGTNFKGYTVS